MAEQAGKTNVVYVLAGTTAMTGSTGVKINGVDNTTYKKLCNILEIGQFGEDYLKRIPGKKDTSISLSGNLDTADTNGQLELVEGSYVMIGLYPSGTGVAGKQVPCILESFEESYDANGKQTFSCSALGNGAPVALSART